MSNKSKPFGMPPAQIEFQKAVSLYQARKYEEALAIASRLIRSGVKQKEVHYIAGMAFYQLKKYPDAISSLRASVKLDPNNAQFLASLAVALSDGKENEEALETIDRTLALMPRYALAHFNRANILKDLGRVDEALDAYKTAVTLQPDYASAYHNLANLLHQLGRSDEALPYAEAAAAGRPNDGEFCNTLGNVLLALRKFLPALAWINKAIEHAPDLPQAHMNRALALFELRRFEEALVSLDRAMEKDEPAAVHYRVRADILRQMGRKDESVDVLEEGFKKGLTEPGYVGGLLHQKMMQARWDGLEPLQKICDTEVDQNNMFTALATSHDRAMLLAIARAQTSALNVLAKTVAAPSVRLKPDRLRIAYLSADFRAHPVARLVVGMLERHDRDRFEVIGVQLGEQDHSDIGNRIRAAFPTLIDADEIDDADLAAQLRAREIDVGIDLMGHTRDARMGVWARRIAPAQATYLGFAGTTGLDAFDYLIGDSTIIPETHFADYSEKIVHLPETFWVTDGIEPVPALQVGRDSEGLPADAFVFCCFNQIFKILPEVFDLWMKIMVRAPGSVLWLRSDDEDVMRRLRQEAEARGVAGQRLIFARSASADVHKFRLSFADLVLDTLPYNAHTTCYDALLVGVPVLTRPGETFSARVAASQLRAIGAEDLVVSTPSEYEDRAVALAQDRAGTAALRQRLLSQRFTHPLFDTTRFTRHMEAAYEAMSARARQGLPPAPLKIDPLPSREAVDAIG